MLFDPFEEIRRIQERMNRLFEEFERRFPEVRETRFGIPVDVIDEGEKFRVIADLPGFNKEDIEVYFEDGDLVIKAERKVEEEEKGRDYLRRERRYGVFVRRVSIPVEVDVANVKARYNNGVLEVTIPKKVKEKARIQIE
ncbi:MAG: Hsp20/alpha crystallin family protein [Archaeoglobaceae archaeon]